MIGVRGDPQHPANFGKLCAKGRTLHLAAAPALVAHARQLHPELRRSRDEPRQRVEWDVALEHAAHQFAAAIRNGPDRVAFYLSGQLLTEDYYAFNKLARGFDRDQQYDSNSRLCMSSAVAGYKRTLGADAPPCSSEDIELAISYHRGRQSCRRASGPVRPLLERVARGACGWSWQTRGRRKRHAPLTSSSTRARSDLYLFAAMLHVMLRDGLVNRQFIDASTAGFEAVAAQARGLDLADAARLCALPVEISTHCTRIRARARCAVALLPRIDQARTAPITTLRCSSAPGDRQIGRPELARFR